MKKHLHDLSHYRLFTCDMGKLIPCGIWEALPGDHVKHRADLFMRVSPTAAPVMHPVHVRLHHFFIPNRLIWEPWEDFITGGNDGNNADTIPQTTTTLTKFMDYLYGIQASGVSVNRLPIYAYNSVYNEFYRDQDLVTEAGLGSTTLQNIAWEKDYFTASRPWTQRGDDVTLPVGSSAPVTGIGVRSTTWAGAGGSYETDATTSTTYTASKVDTGVNNINEQLIVEEDPNNAGYPNIRADLSASTAVNINDFRRAFALQRYKEARARWGARYSEYLRSIGVNPRDSRLQRPEYLGGGKSTIQFSEVLQTAPETGTGPTNSGGVGDMYGHGVTALRANGYTRVIPEHGFVMSFLSVRPKTMYMNGLHRSMLRLDKEDFYQKELEFIGQQGIQQNEIYADSTNTPDDIFGYTDRYREYREHPSTVHGDFRSVLDHWHMARNLGASPTLNQSFIECDATKRIHNVQTNDVLWCMVKHKLGVRRHVSRSAYGKII